MATALVTIGFAGLLVLAGMIAARWSVPGREGGNGPGGGRGELAPIRHVGDPDAELRRILADGRFGDLNLGRRAPLHNRRGTA